MKCVVNVGCMLQLGQGSVNACRRCSGPSLGTDPVHCPTLGLGRTNNSPSCPDTKDGKVDKISAVHTSSFMDFIKFSKILLQITLHP